ncbi:nucleoside permease nupX [Escherichia coli]|nr:nucleoside permease nupX [Escherichia coli]EFK4584470.1 nucleoside permease nupX [Escherichia coli]
MDVMRSVLGMVVLLAIAFLLSVNKKKISLRTVGAALVLQVVIGGIMLWLPPGRCRGNCILQESYIPGPP